MFTSISIIAVIAFLVTLGVVGYEVVQLRRKKQIAPPSTDVTIPDYKQDPKAVESMMTIPAAQNQQVVSQSVPDSLEPLPQSVGSMPSPPPMDEHSYVTQDEGGPSRSKLIYLIPIVIILLLLGGGGMYMYFSSQSSEGELADVTVPTPSEVISPTDVPEPTEFIVIETPAPTIEIGADENQDSEESTEADSDTEADDETGENGTLSGDGDIPDAGEGSDGETTPSTSEEASTDMGSQSDSETSETSSSDDSTTSSTEESTSSNSSTESSSQSSNESADDATTSLPTAGVVDRAILLATISLVLILFAFVL